MRIKKAGVKCRDVVKEYDAEGEDSKLYRAVSNVLAEHEHVYMEMGIPAGFRLAKEIERIGEEEGLCEQYKEMYSSLFWDVTEVIEALKRAQQVVEEMYI